MVIRARAKTKTRAAGSTQRLKPGRKAKQVPARKKKRKNPWASMTPEQREAAELSLAEYSERLRTAGYGDITTEIRPLGTAAPDGADTVGIVDNQPSTMTPHDYSRVRPHLGSSSGFQSRVCRQTWTVPSSSWTGLFLTAPISPFPTS